MTVADAAVARCRPKACRVVAGTFESYRPFEDDARQNVDCFSDEVFEMLARFYAR